MMVVCRGLAVRNVEAQFSGAEVGPAPGLPRRRGPAPELPIMSDNPTRPGLDPSRPEREWHLFIQYCGSPGMGNPFDPFDPLAHIISNLSYYLDSIGDRQTKYDLSRFLKYGRQLFGRPVVEAHHELVSWL